MKLHRARSSAELGEVASGSVTQGLWLRNRKVGPKHSLGEEQLGKSREEEDEEEEPATK